MKYRFAPAAPDEDIVYGACRPTHPRMAPETSVDDWVNFMEEQGIERVCCLLDEELDDYDDLLGTYRRTFGDSDVCHVPIEDFGFIDPDSFYSTVLPFLQRSADNGEPTVVHCSAGSGRTGHVLVLWLVSERGYAVEEAIQVVRDSGREPLEKATRSDLAAILDMG